MNFLGLDISSSSTGWNIVEVDNGNKKLINYGLISPIGNMGVTQRLYFFGNELRKIIDKYQPDEIAAEETILVRGPKIMRTLSRFSGVALFLAYSYQKREICTYEPSMWKKDLGLRGSAEKPEIQLKICESFNLMEKDKIEKYSNEFNSILEQKNKVRKEEHKEVQQLNKANSKLEATFIKSKREFNKKKKKEKTEEVEKNLKELELELQLKKEILKTKKKNLQDLEREVSKKIEKMSTDIYSDSGVNPDIADSIGVTLKIIHETIG
jgi:crossover junction endodeoxyribonuclease RuvC